MSPIQGLCSNPRAANALPGRERCHGCPGGQRRDHPHRRRVLRATSLLAVCSRVNIKLHPKRAKNWARCPGEQRRDHPHRRRMPRVASCLLTVSRVKIKLRPKRTKNREIWILEKGPFLYISIPPSMSIKMHHFKWKRRAHSCPW